MRALPTVITSRNKFRIGVLSLLLLITIYGITSMIRLRPLFELTPSAVDGLFPLLPASIWIYMSYPLLFMSAYTLEQDTVELNRFFYADVGANVLSWIVFLGFPTTFKRPALPEGELDISTAALELYWRIDEPVNCLPSLHVSTSFLPALLLWRNHRRASWVYLAWATLISISTMTTKQHHCLDVAAGIVVAAIMYAVFFFRVQYQLASVKETAQIQP